MYAYCTSSHMSEQFKKWPIKYHFGWLSWPAKIHIKYCTLYIYIYMLYIYIYIYIYTRIYIYIIYMYVYSSNPW